MNERLGVENYSRIIGYYADVMEEALFEAPPLCYKSLPVQRKEILENGGDRTFSGDQLQPPKDL